MKQAGSGYGGRCSRISRGTPEAPSRLCICRASFLMTFAMGRVPHSGPQQQRFSLSLAYETFKTCHPNFPSLALGQTKSGGKFTNSWNKKGASRWLNGKESTCQCMRCRRYGFDPWVRKIPWKRKWQPTVVFLPRKFYGQRIFVGYRPWGYKESDMCEHTHRTKEKLNI